MRVFTVTEHISNIFFAKGLHLSPEKEALILLGTVDFTYLVKLNFAQQHLEVIDLIEVENFQEVYLKDHGFLFVKRQELQFIPFSQIANDEDSTDAVIEIDDNQASSFECKNSISFCIFSLK